MDTRFLFGTDETSNADQVEIDVDIQKLNEISPNLKDELEYSKTQLLTLKDQVRDLETGNVKDSFQFRKCMLLVEYLNNVYAFHALKNKMDTVARKQLLIRLNNLKCMLDRLAPLESRLASYLKDTRKNQSYNQHSKSKNQKDNDSTVIDSVIDDNAICLRPNLHAFIDETEVNNQDEFQQNISTMASTEFSSPSKTDNREIPNIDELLDNDQISESTGGKLPKSKPNKSSVFIPSKSKYVPYEDTTNERLTSRMRKEIQDEQMHKKELQQTIVDDLLNLDSDAPITTGMREVNNAGFFEKTNPFSKSSSRRDLQMLKDRRLVLMMNDNNGDGDFTDATMEKLAETASNKFNSKKHKQKLVKRRLLRSKFRKKMSKLR